MLRVIENTLYGLEQVLDEELANIATTEKPLADLRFELTRSFDGTDRLAKLLVRQREINSRLDLDKDQAGAAEEASAAV